MVLVCDFKSTKSLEFSTKMLNLTIEIDNTRKSIVLYSIGNYILEEDYIKT